jgi:choline dehydrogenase
VLEQPGVGQNLQNHLVFKLAYATHAPITAYRYLSPDAGLEVSLRYALARSGFLGEGPSPVGGFFRSDPGLPRPDLQVFAAPVMAGLLGKGLRALMPSAHGFSLFVSQGRPASRGEVKLASGDPERAPLIDPRYFSDLADLEQLARGVERMREVAAQPALEAVTTRETAPGPEVAGRAGVRDAIRRLATGQHHPAGTCRMGSAGSEAVVDAELRVHGVAALRIADASVMPELLTGNINAPVIMIAERAADLLLGRAS